MQVCLVEEGHICKAEEVQGHCGSVVVSLSSPVGLYRPQLQPCTTALCLCVVGASMLSLCLLWQPCTLFCPAGLRNYAFLLPAVMTVSEHS